MKRFIRHIALFALPIAVLMAGLECVAELIPNSYTYKHNYMTQRGAHIRTLILGSSYAYDGLAPEVLPLAFNLANSSQTLEDDYRLLKYHIGSMDSLRTVVLGVGYGTWADRSEDYRKCYYTIYMNLYPRWPISKYSFEVFNLELLTKKLIKYALSRDVTRCDSLGQRIGHDALSATKSIERWNKDIISLVNTDRIDLSRSRDDIAQNCSYIDSIASLCLAHNAQLVVVAMPARAEYKALLPQEQLALQDSVLEHLQDRAVCIDASDWAIPADGWYNATHLTKEASKEFTRRLCDFCHP